MLPVVEEPDARRRDLPEVEVLTLVKKLEVGQVTSTFTALTGDGVERLCNLVICAHHRYRTWSFEADLGDEPGQPAAGA